MMLDGDRMFVLVVGRIAMRAICCTAGASTIVFRITSGTSSVATGVWRRLLTPNGANEVGLELTMRTRRMLQRAAKLGKVCLLLLEYRVVLPCSKSATHATGPIHGSQVSDVSEPECVVQNICQDVRSISLHLALAIRKIHKRNGKAQTCIRWKVRP